MSSFDVLVYLPGALFTTTHQVEGKGFEIRQMGAASITFVSHLCCSHSLVGRWKCWNFHHSIKSAFKLSVNIEMFTYASAKFSTCFIFLMPL